MEHPIAKLLKQYQLVLGSQSPRRRELLERLGLPFQTRVFDGEETIDPSWETTEIAERLACLKAEGLLGSQQENELLITADTVVIASSGEVLGKPKDLIAAKTMLQGLSATRHRVISGVCLQSLHKQESFAVCSWVTFKKLDEELIDFYIENYPPLDKAGAYGIQEWIGLACIEKIEGCYFNVMGLPTSLLFSRLREW